MNFSASRTSSSSDFFSENVASFYFEKILSDKNFEIRNEHIILFFVDFLKNKELVSNNEVEKIILDNSFCEFINFSQKKLTKIGFNEESRLLIKILASSTKLLMNKLVMDKPVFSNWDNIIDWCHAELAFSDREEFHLLCLNSKNHLIGREIISLGTIDQAIVYTREVVRSALENNSAATIFVHNHPSGDPRPSKQDVILTNQLEAALKQIGIKVIDHIIIGKYGNTSFRAAGLM